MVENLERVRLKSGLTSEIDLLKGQLAAIITGSIESKIRRLESSIRAGTVSQADLGMIQDLKNDLDILKTYSAPRATAFEPMTSRVASSRLEASDNQKLFQEVSNLKYLFYVSIASCGLLVVVIGGFWLQHLHRHKQLQRDLREPVLLEKRGKKPS